MPRLPGGERVLGPYPARRDEFVVKHIKGARAEAGSTISHYFTDEDEALGFAEELRKQIGLTAIGINTVDDAITAYEKHKRAEFGDAVNEYSISETIRRVRLFFKPVLKLRFALLTQPRCRNLYQALVDAKDSKPIEDAEPDADGNVPTHEVSRYAAATHRNMLLQARSFLKWATEKKFIARNVLVGVQGQGKPKKGKPQLKHRSDARAWLDKACELADTGDVGAVAAMMTLLLGARASEIVERKVKDVDDDARVFVILDTKTEAGERNLEIPELLRPYLARQIKDRKGDEWLFPAESKSGRHWRDWPRLHVQRICDLAGVPVVGAHGMRGTAASLARDAGALGGIVAASLGHTNVRMQEQAYARRDAVQQGQQRRALKLLTGGKKR